MISYEELKQWPCYGCAHAMEINYMIPIFYCKKKRHYIKKKRNCKHREDGHPSNIYHIETEHKKGVF